MKIQISPIKIVKDALVVWHEPTPETDIIMDPKNLTFTPGTVEEIYSFHVLDHLFQNEIDMAILNWKKNLRTGGKVFIVVDDFEFIARQFIGGDIDMKDINDRYSHPTYFRKESLIDIVLRAGFLLNNIVMWFADVADKFKKQDFELIFSIEKHD